VVYIREIARNLYELKNRLEELQQAYDSEPPGERRDELQLELNRTRQEYERVKSILEGAKECS
jgi:DNA-binding transcriptional regulator GbsR (MarR family)